jgi:PAT family beta-lactamase induction signal transducer AmpG
VTIEQFTGAIGTVIFVAYLSALCHNPLHTATQYALLTALASVGRIYLSASAGYVAQASGWPMFFAISVVVAVPSLLLLAWLQRRGHFAESGGEGGVNCSDFCDCRRVPGALRRAVTLCRTGTACKAL